jgi:hypothetical protein
MLYTIDVFMISSVHMLLVMPDLKTKNPNLETSQKVGVAV